MPHSSRRKKAPSPYDNKLVNVALDDGWSTVSRKANANDVLRSKGIAQLDTSGISQYGQRSLRGSPQNLLERLTYDQVQALAAYLPDQYQSIDRYNGSSQRPDLSEAQVNKGYEDKAGKWRNSKAAKDVEDILIRRVGVGKLNGITKAICLGSGSFSSLQQATSSQWQIVAFVAMVEVLRNATGREREIELYAQEPMYNSVDKSLMESLSIEVLQSPAAFELCDENAFIFAPHVQLTLWTSSMREGKTALILGNDIAKSNQQYVSR